MKVTVTVTVTLLVTVAAANQTANNVIKQQKSAFVGVFFAVVPLFNAPFVSCNTDEMVCRELVQSLVCIPHSRSYIGPLAIPRMRGHGQVGTNAPMLFASLIRSVVGTQPLEACRAQSISYWPPVCGKRGGGPTDPCPATYPAPPLGGKLTQWMETVRPGFFLVTLGGSIQRPLNHHGPAKEPSSKQIVGYCNNITNKVKGL